MAGILTRAELTLPMNTLKLLKFTLKLFWYFIHELMHDPIHEKFKSKSEQFRAFRESVIIRHVSVFQPLP